jgi:hypothetical protein
MTTKTATVFIERPPVPDFGFTTLSNVLFECITYNLKPRDLAVLNYLFTKRADWEVKVADIAIHCCICPNTVYAALRVLQERGIAWWRRLKTGKTQWFIRLPESPATPVVEPHTKKPHPIKPHPKFCDVLTNNEKETIIKKTTTDPEPENTPICEEKVVVTVVPQKEVIVACEEVAVPCTETVGSTKQQADESFKPVPDFTVLDKMNEHDKQAATSALQKINNTTLQAALLFRLNKAITNGTIKSTPLAYLHGLIAAVKKGSFDLRSELIVMKKAQEAAKPKPLTPSKPLTPEDEKAQRLAKLRNLASKHPDAIPTAQEKGCWYVSGYGIFIKKDFEEAGLITS